MADELTVQPSSKDTYLNYPFPTSNYGTATSIFISEGNIYTKRGILEFDISALPSGVTILSALLKLYYHWAAGASSTGKTTWAYKLTRNDWVEAEATWNIYKTGSNWTASGGDFVTSSPSGGSDIVPVEFGWMEWDVADVVEDAIDVESWSVVELLVKFATDTVGAESRIDFYSKEYSGDTSLRPKLVIEYIMEKEGDDIGNGVEVLELSAILTKEESGTGVDSGVMGLTVKDSGSTEGVKEG